MSRRATHAGSWYSDDGDVLSNQLDKFLRAVQEPVKGIGAASKLEPPVSYPVAGARVIIAPHAGYSYSGPAAAWAYKAVDWRKCKRIFLLGPSHHVYLDTCALSAQLTYETPCGDLQTCASTIGDLKLTGAFTQMTRKTDEDEHSLEMHLPYIYKMLQLAGQNPNDEFDYHKPFKFPPLVPILVGNISPEKEAAYGKILAPYLNDPTTVFIASSDFCHWGARFSYKYYLPTLNLGDGKMLGRSRPPSNPPIHESIATVDHMCMDAVESGNHQAFTDIIKETGNTVCGRHPIGIVMAALEVLEKEGTKTHADDGRFKFVKYDRSGLVHDVSDSSVSYCSAYAVLRGGAEKGVEATNVPIRSPSFKAALQVVHGQAGSQGSLASRRSNMG